MAKQIKAIKCPQCGSTQNTQIKDDYYKCDNCGTEYFLDNDDINVNVNIQNPHQPPVNKKIPIVIVSGIIACAIIFMMILILKPDRRSKLDSYKNIMLDSPVEVGGKPYILTLLSDKEGGYYQFTDPNSEKIIKTEKIPGVKTLSIALQDLNIRKFSNGDVYVLIDQQRLFKLNKKDMTLDDVTISMFEGDSLYTSGIATIDWRTSEGMEGDRLQVMTNTGKEYFYYPRTKKSYTKQELSKHIYSKETLSADSREAVKFLFTEKKDNSPEIQLIKIKYHDNAGGPENTRFESKIVNKDGESEILRKGNRWERIISYKNHTPDRVYYNPEIFYQDKNHLLIKVTATASEKSAPSLQRIDTETGELMWTLPLEVENNRYVYYFHRSVHADNKFVLKLKDSPHYRIIDDDGKNTKYFTLKQL